MDPLLPIDGGPPRTERTSALNASLGRSLSDTILSSLLRYEDLNCDSISKAVFPSALRGGIVPDRVPARRDRIGLL